MSNSLEQIQKRVCKIIYGWDIRYDDLVNDGIIEPLYKRRERLTMNFAKKAVQSERFSKWFPLKNNPVNLRNCQKYEEFYARTERLKKSPLFYMRRGLNAD